MAHLTMAQISQFNEDGYLVVEDLLEFKEDLEPVILEYEAILDNLVKRLFAEGEISSLYNDLSFAKRLTRVQHETSKIFFRNFDIALPKREVKEFTPISIGPKIFAFLRNEKLLDLVESLIGSEIFANPIQHVRLKQPVHLNPQTEQKLPWLHQDNAFMMPEGDQTEMITLWIPLMDTDEQNGCLQLIPRSHHEGLKQHCKTGVVLPENLIDRQRTVPVPVKQGSVLLMHRCMMHGPLPNRTDTLRWSFDLRYNPSDSPSGRDIQPGFIARSKLHPASEVRNSEEWANLWLETRRRLSNQSNPVYERWDSDEPGCA